MLTLLYVCIFDEPFLMTAHIMWLPMTGGQSVKVAGQAL